MTDRVRVLLVDDHAVVRLGLRTLLAAAPDVDVVGEASDGAEALALVERLRPDVVVMDLSMAGMDGAAATRELTRRGATARVLVLTMHEEEDYLVPLLEAGARGYVVKSAVSTELLEAVRTVAHGGTFVRPAAARVLAAAWTRRGTQDDAEARYAALSDREREVFRLTTLGHTPARIGEQLAISAKTVDTYRRRIVDKLAMPDRAEWVRLALRLGILGDDA
ncbi:MAG: response regulator transcription factor [Gemmatirosa sp.]|nr:response regulator transcription factor [Gemmatirosa sp.]